MPSSWFWLQAPIQPSLISLMGVVIQRGLGWRRLNEIVEFKLHTGVGNKWFPNGVLCRHLAVMALPLSRVQLLPLLVIPGRWGAVAAYGRTDQCVPGNLPCIPKLTCCPQVWWKMLSWHQGWSKTELPLSSASIFCLVMCLNTRYWKPQEEGVFLCLGPTCGHLVGPCEKIMLD